MSFTDIHNDPRIGGIDSTSAFLGGETGGISHADSFTCRNGEFMLSHGARSMGGQSFNSVAMTKAMSLESLVPSSGSFVAPIMMAMPETRAEKEARYASVSSPLTVSALAGKDSRNELFEGIQMHSWLLPYIVKGLSDTFIAQLLQLPPVLSSSKAAAAAAAKSAALGTGIYSEGSTSDFVSPTKHASSDDLPAISAAAPSISHPSSLLPPSVAPFGFLMRYSWTCLGQVLLNKDPSWRTWERRLVLLCDNYLFEVDAAASKIIGFAMLDGCDINIATLAVDSRTIASGYVMGGATDGDKQTVSGSIATSSDTWDNFIEGSSTPRSGDGASSMRRSSSNSNLTGTSRSVREALSVTVLRQSLAESSKVTFWVMGVEERDTSHIEALLRRASKLTADDVYAFGNKEESVLGRGRYNEVRMGRRKVFKPLSAKNKHTNRSRCRNLAGERDREGEGVRGTTTRASDVTSSSEDDSDESQSLCSSTHSSPPDSPEHSLRLQPSTKTASSFPPDAPDILSLKPPKNLLLPDANDDNDVFFSLLDDDSKRSSVEKTRPPVPHAGLSSEKYALKLVSKEIFWKRSAAGKERPDGLVREFLAQALACEFARRRRDASAAAATATMATVAAASADVPIVDIYGAFESIDGFAFELELMQHNDLYDKLSFDGVFSEEETKEVVLQLIDAISMCHSAGIAHRDIKLSNVTFPRSEPSSSSPPPSYSTTIKLADFGMAGFVGVDGKLKGRCGTPGYVAPDILNASANEAYSINVDMFSVGVCAYTLLCGYEPFYGEDDRELIRSNKTVDYEFHDPEWTDISPACKGFIEWCLAERAEDRPSPGQALTHPWLARS